MPPPPTLPQKYSLPWYSMALRNRGMTVEGAGHQHLGLAGLGVNLDQHALGFAAVGFFQEEGAVVEGVEGSLQDLVIVLVPRLLFIRERVLPMAA